jgi:hypothetical protein
LAAILNRYYNFTVAYSPIFLNWYVGEISTAVFVSNIPLCWPLIQRIFGIDAWGNSKRSRSNEHSNSNIQSSSKRFYVRSTMRSGGERLPSNLGSEERITGSEERIIGTWTPETDGQLELKPVDHRTGFKTSVAVGNEVKERNENWKGTGKETIVKTVQVSQHSS